MTEKTKIVWLGVLIFCLSTAGAAFAQVKTGTTGSPTQGYYWGSQGYPSYYGYGYPTTTQQVPAGKVRIPAGVAQQTYPYPSGTQYPSQTQYPQQGPYPQQGQYPQQSQYPAAPSQYQFPTVQGQYPSPTGQYQVPPGTYIPQQVPSTIPQGQYLGAPSQYPTAPGQYPTIPGQPPTAPGQPPATQYPYPAPQYPGTTAQPTVPQTQPSTVPGQYPTTQAPYPTPGAPAPTAQPQPSLMPGQIPSAPLPTQAPVPTMPTPTAPAGAVQPPTTAPTGLPFQPSTVGPQMVPAPARPTSPFLSPLLAPFLATAPQPELSPFEQYVSGQIPTSISFDIKQFGYDLFLQQAPAPPLVSQDVPVNSDYVVGPGDEIRVTVWGNIDAAWNMVVDRDGNISIPRLGVLGVAGLSFKEVKETIHKEMTKYYTEFQLNVTMGPLKTIRVYVVGNARFPGAYTISSLSTLINALVASGGPSKAGSMRDIQLKRGEEVVSHLDLYDLLMRGDKSKDQRVMSEDVIFIPSIGSLVGIAGNVERPAIYELQGRTKVSDVIKMAGGVTAEAYLQRVQVERVFQRKSKVILDLNLQSVKGKDDVFLEGGDIVKVFSIVSTVTNMITLQGNVRRPGEYEWKQGLRVKDIIPSFDALLPDTMLEYAIVERKIAPDLHLEYRSFDLGALLTQGAEDQNIPLQPYDVVTVFNKTNVRQLEKVRIAGAVNVPGEFEFRPNMKVSDLLKVAGGLKAYAFTEEAELTRTVPTQQGPSNERLSVNLSEALAGAPQSDVLLKENDYLLVKSVPDWELYKHVLVLGEVKFPGGYALKKGDVLSSLIERTGGYSKGAYLRGAAFTRVSVKALQQMQIVEMANRIERELLASLTTQVSTATTYQEAEVLGSQLKQKNAFLQSLRMVEAKGRMVVHLDEPAKMKNTSGDIMLEDGDLLIIPTNPQTVQVLGAVYNQSSFVYNPKKDISYYIEQAGGFGETANKKQVYVLKCDGSAGKPKGGILWDADSNRWESGSSGAIEAGDTIVVPDKLEEFAWLRNIKDITQIIYQVAVGAGVLLRVR